MYIAVRPYTVEPHTERVKSCWRRVPPGGLEVDGAGQASDIASGVCPAGVPPLNKSCRSPTPFGPATCWVELHSLIRVLPVGYHHSQPGSSPVSKELSSQFVPDHRDCFQTLWFTLLLNNNLLFVVCTELLKSSSSSDPSLYHIDVPASPCAPQVKCAPHIPKLSASSRRGPS